MFLDLLRQRRSIRKFTGDAITSEQLQQLQEAILRAPSSRGLDPWQFIFVTDPEVITALSKAKPNGAAFLEQAKLAVVICADPERSDVWVEDCAIAAFCLQLQVSDSGLASCWAQIRCRQHEDGQSSEEYVRQLVKLPSTMRVDSIIGIGVGDEEKSGHDCELLKWSRIHDQSYSEE
ncbi:MAG: nitroreductase family protein [Desulfuromonas sp.]|nr:nitroreductase family protein [Desulfuromonas sp.]